MKRANKGRFAKGNKGGPGRPRKVARGEGRGAGKKYKLMALEPPKGCDPSVYLDWMRYGKWYAVDLGDENLEVRSDDALFESYIQFRVEFKKCGLKHCVPFGIRTVEEGPIHPNEAAICH